MINLAAAAALLAAGAALDTYAVPAVLALVAVLGALYEESAVFDREKGQARFTVGLVFWHRTKIVPLADVVEVRVVGFGPAKFAGLEVGLRDGTVKTIENDRGKAASERLEAWGAELARWLEVPLVR